MRKIGLREVMASFDEHLGGLPETYLCIDIETSGFSKDKDYILQIGHCSVKDGEVKDRGSILLDWRDRVVVKEAYSDFIVHPGAVKERVEKVCQDFARRGLTCRTTWERLCREGSNPTKTVGDYLDWFESLRANMGEVGIPLLMHNGYNFDVDFWDGHAQKLLGRRFTLGEWDLLDTAMLLKAVRYGACALPGETYSSFHNKIDRLPSKKGFKYSLNEYAIPAMKLKEKYPIDENESHDAGYDAYMTHILFKELKAMAAQGLDLEVEHHEQQPSNQ